MTFDLKQLVADNIGKNYDLYEEHVNPRFARALRIIGFDRCYARAKGAYLWDDNGRKYLDMLAGYGAFNIGRNHPVVRQALIDFMTSDGVSLVQMEAKVMADLHRFPGPAWESLMRIARNTIPKKPRAGAMAAAE